MPNLHLLHERKFAGKRLQSFKVYNDPFGESEVCVELAFADRQVACLCIGSGRPQIVSTNLYYDFDGAPWPSGGAEYRSTASK